VRRFCYKCGSTESEENPLIGGLCRSCLSAQPSLRLPKLELVECPRCGAVKVGGHWLEFQEGVRQIVFSHLEVASFESGAMEFVKAGEIGAQVKVEAEKRRGEVRIQVRSLQPEVGFLQTSLPIKKETCRICRLKSGGYYEAILQVRGKNLENVRKLLEEEVSKTSKEDGRLFITRVEEVEGGLDYYLSSVELARRLGRLLRTKHGAQLSETAKLVGSRGGRRRYRVSVLARVNHHN